MTNKVSDLSSVLPGQPVGSLKSNVPGPAVHMHDSKLLASIAGPAVTTPPATKGSKPAMVSISRPSGDLPPEVGTTVLGKITRTTPRQATLSILALGDTGNAVLKEPFPALIRQQDIRATELDKVKVNECFRVGDVVRAVVISLGDERAYYLSTSKNELGVVMAMSEGGNQMFPVSWREFQDSVTGTREQRKVAKTV